MVGMIPFLGTDILTEFGNIGNAQH